MDKATKEFVKLVDELYTKMEKGPCVYFDRPSRPDRCKDCPGFFPPYDCRNTMFEYAASKILDAAHKTTKQELYIPDDFGVLVPREEKSVIRADAYKRCEDSPNCALVVRNFRCMYCGHMPTETAIRVKNLLKDESIEWDYIRLWWEADGNEIVTFENNRAGE